MAGDIVRPSTLVVLSSGRQRADPRRTTTSWAAVCDPTVGLGHAAPRCLREKRGFALAPPY